MESSKPKAFISNKNFISNFHKSLHHYLYFQFTKTRADTTMTPPINKFKENFSCNPIIEKRVENTGTKNKKLLATVAPLCPKLKNHNPNEPTEAGIINHTNQIQPHKPKFKKS